MPKLSCAAATSIMQLINETAIVAVTILVDEEVLKKMVADTPRIKALNNPMAFSEFKRPCRMSGGAFPASALHEINANVTNDMYHFNRLGSAS